MTSFPKRSRFHKVIACFVALLTLVSIAIIALKVCHIAIPSDGEEKSLQTNDDINNFVSTYFIKLHILHTIILVCVAGIIALGFIDLVPRYDEDLKFAFHFVSAFVITVVGFLTLYSAYVAYNKSCTSAEDSVCCGINKLPLTAFTNNDGPMMAVTLLDLMAGILLLSVAAIYFFDTKSEAKESGYLTRIHNSGYTVR